MALTFSFFAEEMWVMFMKQRDYSGAGGGDPHVPSTPLDASLARHASTLKTKTNYVAGRENCVSGQFRGRWLGLCVRKTYIRAVFNQQKATKCSLKISPFILIMHATCPSHHFLLDVQQRARNVLQTPPRPKSCLTKQHNAQAYGGSGGFPYLVSFSMESDALSISSSDAFTVNFFHLFCPFN